MAKSAQDAHARSLLSMTSTDTRTCSRRLKRKVERAQEGFHRLSTNHLYGSDDRWQIQGISWLWC
ncbi:hypothetical protein Hanom_Chr03g00214821 [Helianthus anomalus]